MRLQDDCHRGQGVALMHGKTITGCAVTAQATCTIIAARPADFRDELRLVALGHELLHASGGSTNKARVAMRMSRRLYDHALARVMELVDISDLKSEARKGVRVRFPP